MERNWLQFLWLNLLLVCAECPFDRPTACDRLCVTAQWDFDSADCRALCDCSDLELSNGVCEEACNTWQCGFDGGACVACAAGCNTAALGDGICDLNCFVETCNYDSGDCSTAQSPNVVYVQPGSDGGTGTSQNPYLGLETALNSLWQPANRLYLLAGEYLLLSSQALLATAGLQYTEIRTLFCAASPAQTNCASSRAALRFTASLPTFQVSHTVLITDIDMYGDFALRPDCPLCTFCPYMALRGGLWVDDLGRTIDPNDHAEESLCRAFSTKKLIQINASGQLTLENVSFIRFQQQLQAIISMQCGSLSLHNVTFASCAAAVHSALISFTQTSSSPYSCGTIEYIDGVVEGLNEVWAYRQDLTLGGVLKAAGALLIHVENVSFLDNSIAYGQGGVSLIDTFNCRQIALQNLTFQRSISTLSPLISLRSSLAYPLVLDSNQTSTEAALLHISLFALSFQRNIGNGLLTVETLLELQNVDIRDWSVRENMVVSGSLVKIAGSKNDLAAVSGLISPSGVYYPAKYLTMANIHFYNNSLQHLLSVTDIGNFQASNLTISSSGLGVGASPSVYLLSIYRGKHGSGQVFSSSVSCSDFLTAENVGNFEVVNSTWSDNDCEWPGMVLSGDSQVTTIGNVLFLRNIGAGLITQYSNSVTWLSSLSFHSNSNPRTLDPPCLYLYPKAPTAISLTNSSFSFNSGGAAVTALVQNTSNLTIDNIHVTGHVGKYAGAGVIIAPLTTGPSHVSVFRSEFHNCSSQNYGVIAFLDYSGVLSGNTVAVVRVVLVDCVFERIDTVAQGAGFTINNYVQVTADSLVLRCVFRSCTSQRGGAIYLSYQTGVVNITASTFDNCSAPEGGAAVFAHQYPQTTLPTYVLLLNSTITNSQLGSAVYISGYDGSIINMTGKYNLFQGNLHTAYLINGGALVDDGSVYIGNSNTDGGCFVLKSSLLTGTNIQAIANHASGFGGCVFLTSSSTLSLTQSTLNDNKAEMLGGVIYADQSSKATLRAVRAVGNRAARAAVAYFFTGTLSVTLAAFSMNIAEEFAGFELTLANANIRNSTMDGNIAGRHTPGFLLTDTTLTLSDCTFSNQVGQSGVFIASQSSSNVTITRCLFQQGRATNQGGAIYAGLNSVLVLLNSRIEDCSSYSDGGGVMVSQSSLQVDGLVMKSVQSGGLGGGIRAESASVSLRNAVFTDLIGSALSGEDLFSLSVTDSQFANIVSAKGAGIQLLNCSSILLVANSYIELQAGLGAAIIVEASLHVLYMGAVTITGSQFVGNEAEQGGAVVIDSHNLVLSDSHFEGNRASEVAGALLLDCQHRSICNFQVTNCNFNSNQAGKKGGALYWQALQPNLTSCSFANNTASYGADIASFPIYLQPLQANGSRGNYLGEYQGLPLAISLTKVPSGQLYSEVLSFGVFDHAEEMVVFDSSSVLEIVPWDGTNCSIAGSTKAQAVQGVYALRDFTPTCPPGSEHGFQVTSSAISLLSGSSSVSIPSVMVLISFRLCESGETFFNSECLLCPAGTYSFDPELPCKLCPDTAICYGNVTMVPRRGYWRPNAYTDQFIKCLRAEACVGSSAVTVSLTGECGKGYSGNLCQNCIWGYSHSQAYSCAKCPPIPSNLALCGVVILALAGLVWTLVASAISGAARYSALLSVYLRGLLSHAQMIVVAASLDLSWPYFAATFLEQQSAIGSVSDQFFSFECVIAELRGTNEGIFAVKLGILTTLPMVVIVSSLLVWLLIWLIRGVRSLFRKLQSTAAVLLFMLHPTLTRNSFSPFACLQLESGRSYMLSDMSIECWSAAHSRILYLTAVPCILVWVVALPAVVLVLMIRKKGERAEDIRYSFLAKGYSDRFHYWEFAVLSRKVLMISASVFLVSQSVQLQALTVLAVLLFALLAQVYYAPFNVPSLNALETKSILVSAVTVYFGLYYSSNEFANEAKIAFFVALLCGNGVYFYSWLRAVLPLLWQSIKDYIQRAWALDSMRMSVESPRPSSSRQILPVKEEVSVIEAPPNSVDIVKEPHVTFNVVQ